MNTKKCKCCKKFKGGKERENLKKAKNAEMQREHRAEGM